MSVQPLCWMAGGEWRDGMKRISVAALLLATAPMFTGCVHESATFYSQDGRNYFRKGYVEGPAPATQATPTAKPAAEPAPSR
jgi:hypothetical protein